MELQDIIAFVVSQTASPDKTGLDHYDYVATILHLAFEEMQTAPAGHGYIAKSSGSLNLCPAPGETGHCPTGFPLFRLPE